MGFIKSTSGRILKGGGRRWRGWRDDEGTMEVLLRERIIRGERRDGESKVNNRGSACHRKHTMDRDWGEGEQERREMCIERREGERRQGRDSRRRWSAQWTVGVEQKGTEGHEEGRHGHWWTCTTNPSSEWDRDSTTVWRQRRKIILDREDILMWSVGGDNCTCEGTWTR